MHLKSRLRVTQSHWKWRRSIDYTTSYWSASVTIALSCTIFDFELFDVQNIMTLKSTLDIIKGHWKCMAPFNRSRTSSYSSSIVTMDISCTVFEIKRDIGRKTLIFRIPLYLTCTIPYNPFELLPKF